MALWLLTPPRRMELANSRAENHPNISRKNQGLEWCTFQYSVIFEHLHCCSRVFTLHWYLWGGGLWSQLAHNCGFILIETKSTRYHQ